MLVQCAEAAEPLPHEPGRNVGPCPAGGNTLMEIAEGPMQQPHLEPAKNITHKTDARNEFVRAVFVFLPAAAFDQLAALRTAQKVREWAQRWRVNAPCVVKEATFRWAHARSRGMASLSGWHWVGLDPRLLERWRGELRALNALPVDTTGLENPIALFTSDWLTAARAETFDTNGAVRPIEEMETGSLGTAYRDHVLENPSVLAPIAADPLRESQADFLSRARCHWDARVARADKRRCSRSSSRPALRDHVRWLALYQVRTESYAALARAADVDVQTVREAVRQVAALIPIRLRPRSKGGRPRHKP
jgi:hypothetical protein